MCVSLSLAATPIGIFFVKFANQKLLRLWNVSPFKRVPFFHAAFICPVHALTNSPVGRNSEGITAKSRTKAILSRRRLTKTQVKPETGVASPTMRHVKMPGATSQQQAYNNYIEITS